MSTSPLPRELATAHATQLDLTEPRLTIGACEACGHRFRFAHLHCPKCSSDQVIAVSASGRATLFTYSTTPRASSTSGVSAVVQLAEGPKLVTTLVDCDPASLRVGMSLMAVYRTATDPSGVPAFTTA